MDYDKTRGSDQEVLSILIHRPPENSAEAQEQSRNNILFLLRLKITTRNVSEGFLYKTPIPRLRVLKLRVSALRLFICGETPGFIITRSVSEGFTQTLPKTLKHNPSLTQRVGIDANAQLQNLRVGL